MSTSLGGVALSREAMVTGASGEPARTKVTVPSAWMVPVTSTATSVHGSIHSIQTGDPSSPTAGGAP